MPEEKRVLGGLSGEDGESFFNAKKGYTEKEIVNLSDLSGGSKTEMPTAVPSPFARFDLVATAFKNIINNDKLEADKSSDKIKASKHDMQLVSHTLDLAEIIFNRNGYFGNSLEILTWNRKVHLAKLDEHPKNKKFAASLKLYLEQDEQAYNFDKMENIYLFKYGGFTIGSTSPITLFCPSASIKDLAGLKITRLVGGTAFSDEYLPLYKRADDFQKWFYYLLKAFDVAGYSESLNDISTYALRSKDILQKSNKNLWEEIHKIEQIQRDSEKKEYNFMAKNYAIMEDKQNAKVEILGVTLGIAKADDLGEKFKNSDYIINTDKYLGDKPLVLQKGVTLKGFKYIDSDFPSNTDVPYYNPKPWDSKRNMPAYDGLEWHYLTVCDFLEPYLVRTIYPISAKKFSTFGGQSDSNHNGYLLPLKKGFFRFFSIKDLEQGKKVNLSMVPQDGGKTVEVTLKVPIQKGEFITFRRIYKEGEPSQMDQNIIDGGIIVQAKFGVTIFPFVKIKKEVKDELNIKNDYRVQLVDADKNLKYTKYSLEFYSQENINPIIPKEKENEGNNRIRSDKTKDNYSSSSTYYRVQEQFDFIQFEINEPEITAIIIPTMKEFDNSGAGLTFAVDFGTTNTYVAYKTDDAPKPRAFDLNDSIASLFDETCDEKIIESKIRQQNAAGDIIDLIDKEFVPRNIGRSSNNDTNHFTFPQRTAMAYNEDMPDDLWGDGLDTLLEGNIPFGYEKVILKGYSIDTNLKWDDPDDKLKKKKSEREAYLEQLAMLMQAKVMCENASLKKTKLIWFYPKAMSKTKLGLLESLWEKNFIKYFLNSDLENRLISVMESRAPFYANLEDEALKGKSVSVVSVDIGGGTTDVAVFQGGDLKATTSFKFAGDALFGTYPTGKNADKNGFVHRCAPEFKKLLEKHRVPRGILDGLLTTNRASDVNAFLFSVENSIKFWTKDKNMASSAAFSYTDMLLQEHDDLKFLIFYFYVALLFHISKILKNKQLETDGKPLAVNFLLFSGTASKMLHILGTKQLAKYTQKIFEELQLNKNVKIILAKDPKEITCHGGLNVKFDDIKKDNAKDEEMQIQNLIYTCIKGKEFSDVTYSDYQNNTENIKEELIDFHKFFFKLNEYKDYRFSDFFGVPPEVTSYAQRNYEDLITIWLEDSISRNQNEDEGEVSETPFFMPLKGVISELSERIAKGEIK